MSKPLWQWFTLRILARWQEWLYLQNQQVRVLGQRKFWKCPSRLLQTTKQNQNRRSSQNSQYQRFQDLNINLLKNIGKRKEDLQVNTQFQVHCQTLQLHKERQQHLLYYGEMWWGFRNILDQQLQGWERN